MPIIMIHNMSPQVKEIFTSLPSALVRGFECGIYSCNVMCVGAYIRIYVANRLQT